MLRRLNYREVYYPNMTTSQARDLQVHADHCIEFLRASVMCHPDTTSLTTFSWDQMTSKPILSNERPIHRCVDWQSLRQSLRDRVVDEKELRGMA